MCIRDSRRREHFITFEDPIEYVYPTKDIPSLISQREIGEDDEDFAEALRGSLRQAPDVIMVGEIRDGETAEIALQAAETGHVVVATLHTSSAAQTVQRFLKLNVIDEGISEILSVQDSDGNGRYEIEILLGALVESHIIIIIEYWDIERRRYPQFDHTAVIIAEDITSRFLNVISLFNGFIPLMAIQVTAIKTEDGVGLQFTKVLDTVTLGMTDEDEEVSEITDRDYWLKRATPKTVAMVDDI